MGPILVVLALGTALAGERREVLPAREIERPLHLPKGWIEIQPGVARGSHPWRSATETLTLGRGSLALRGAPWAAVELRGSVSGTSTRGLSAGAEPVLRPGRLSFGGSYAFLWKDAPMRSLVAEIDVSSPAMKGPTSLVLNPDTPGPERPLDLPAWTARLGLAGRHQLSPFAWSGRIGGELRGLVSEAVVAPMDPEHVAPLRPGHGLDLNTSLDLQLGPLVLRGGVAAGYTQPARFLAEGAGFQVVPGTEGPWVSVDLGLTAHLTRAFDLDAGWQRTLATPRPIFFGSGAPVPLPGGVGWLRGRVRL
ncbi:MAG: hypothetical protein EA397_03900 [Deltaproteobacteria bacterium]|nr:MAG: hypothetical protein EA397_03900 [Deltaproteobacteria bacterium]